MMNDKNERKRYVNAAKVERKLKGGKSASVIPTESEEQETLFEWARAAEHKMPELRRLYHIPNGGLRNKAVAVRLTAEGVRRGVPDICLPVARGGYHGLYIELKRQKGGRITPEQQEWLKSLNEQQFLAGVCFGAKEAIDVITDYLKGAKWETFQQDLSEWVARKHTTDF